LLIFICVFIAHCKKCLFDSIFADERQPPPASKQAVLDLPTLITNAQQEGYAFLLISVSQSVYIMHMYVYSF